MSKFRENDLNEILKDFKEKRTIEIEFERSLDGTITLEDADISYDSKYGFININSKSGSFKINTTLVYAYEKELNEIVIDLETLIIKIKN